tara:strand:+ start:845 stop:1669 length:825 start_codon:yes stop_codon:yes gene_type:complete
MVIFGTGYHGRAAYRVCKNNKIKVTAFIDNDNKKIGKKIFGVKILSPNKINKIINNQKLILCGRNVKDQIKQLNNIIDKNKIITWGSSNLTPPKKKLIKREKKLLELLTFVLDKLNKNKINYWVDRSGLISLIREENLALLSDFDIAINFVDLKKIFKIFKSNNKFQVFKKNIVNNKRFKKIYLMSNNSINSFEPAVIDFIFYIFRKNRVYQYGNTAKNYGKNNFKNFDIKVFKKIEFKIPLNAKNHLKNIYGLEWKKRPQFYENKLKKKITYK